MTTTLKTKDAKSPSRERKRSKRVKKATTTTTRMKRPQHSEWKNLVMKALKSRPTTGMTLKEIYDFVEKNSSAASTSPKTSWQANVRFILSYNSFFVRNPDRKGFWFFSEELHRDQAEEKQRKALDRAKTKDEKRKPTNLPNSFTESYVTTTPHQQYPALASSVDIAKPCFNSGNILPFGIYAAPSHEATTPSDSWTNFDQTYSHRLPSCSYVSGVPHCSYSALSSTSGSAQRSLNSFGFVGGQSESPTMRYNHPEFSEQTSYHNLPSCAYASRFSTNCSNSVPTRVIDSSKTYTNLTRNTASLQDLQLKDQAIYSYKFPSCEYAQCPPNNANSVASNISESTHSFSSFNGNCAQPLQHQPIRHENSYAIYKTYAQDLPPCEYSLRPIDNFGFVPTGIQTYFNPSRQSQGTTVQKKLSQSTNQTYSYGLPPCAYFQPLADILPEVSDNATFARDWTS